MPKFTLITHDNELTKLCESLALEAELAVDLEMEANFHHYGVHLCVVQISNSKAHWVIDMLAIKDTHALVELLENPDIAKVFHDCSFDFRILDYVLNCHPKNVLDTQVAAKLLGKDSLGLGGLYEEYFGLTKNKKWQKSDWLKRPLSPPMLRYAVKDTAYLLQLKDHLADELKTKKRLNWWLEECAALDHAEFEPVKYTCQGVRGARGLSDVERGRFCAMYKIREELAEKADRPVFFILPDKKMLELARNPLSNPGQWKGLKGTHPSVRRNAQRFFEAVKNSQPLKKEKKIGGRPKIRNGELVQVDKLLDKAKKRAAELGIEVPVLLSREQAEAIVLHGNSNHLMSWQREQLNL